MEIETLFDKFCQFNNEYGEFERIEKPLHRRPDITAFLLIDSLTAGPARDMIMAAEHDVIYLDVTPEALAAANPTDEEIKTLIRCGVRVDADEVSMFV